MKDIKYVRLIDLCLIRDNEGKFQLCIDSGGKYFIRLNKFIINESDDKSFRIDLLGEKVDRVRSIDFGDVLFDISNSYSDTSLYDCKIETNVLYMWQIMINDENVQKTLNSIYSSSTTEDERKSLKTQLRSEFFKNLLRGYSSFTKETFEDSKASDVYHYFDKEFDNI